METQDLKQFDLVDVINDNEVGRFIVIEIIQGDDFGNIAYIRDLFDSDRISKIFYDRDTNRWKVDGSNIDYDIMITPVEKARFIDLVLMFWNRFGKYGWEAVSDNLNLTVDDILRYPGLIESADLPNSGYFFPLTVDDIVSNPQYHDLWSKSSQNGRSFFDQISGRELSIDQLASYPEIWDKINWRNFSKQGIFTINDVAQYPGIVDRLNWRIISRRANLTPSEVAVHPDLYDRINWSHLLGNPNFIPAKINDYPELWDKWTTNQLLYSSNVSASDIELYPWIYLEIPYRRIFTKIPEITYSQVATEPEKYIKPQRILSAKSRALIKVFNSYSLQPIRFTIENLISHSELFEKLDWNNISKVISLKDFVTYPELYNRLNWKEISSNPNNTLPEIASHPELYDRLDWVKLSQNAKFSVDDLSAHPEIHDRLDWVLLSYRSYSEDEILSHPELFNRWNWNGLSQQIKLTLAGLSAYPDLLKQIFDYSDSRPFNLYSTISDLEAHPEIYDRINWKLLQFYGDIYRIPEHPEWYNLIDWVQFSKNPELDIEFLSSNRDLWTRLDWGNVSRYAKLTSGDVISHPDFWWVFEPRIESYEYLDYDYEEDQIEPINGVQESDEIPIDQENVISSNEFGNLYENVDKALETYTWDEICRYRIVRPEFLREYMIERFGYDESMIARIYHPQLCDLAQEMYRRRQELVEELVEGVPMAQQVIYGQPGGYLYRQAERQFQERVGAPTTTAVQPNPAYNRLYQMCQDPNSSRADIQHLAHEMDLDILLARLNPEQRTKENYCRILTRYIETTMGRTPQ
jgi:hypothetical protein